MGLERKLKLGSWFVPSFRALYRMRRLRGTKLDPFGRAQVRRVERELIGEYEEMVAEALARLTPETPRHGARAARAAGRDPRLRGDQAAQRGALPQAGRAAAQAPHSRVMTTVEGFGVDGLSSAVRLPSGHQLV